MASSDPARGAQRRFDYLMKAGVRGLRAELHLLERLALGRALYDALTEDGSVRWIRADGKENKLAIAIANYKAKALS